MDDLFSHYNRKTYGKPSETAETFESLTQVYTHPDSFSIEERTASPAVDEDSRSTEEMLLAQAEDRIKFEFEEWKQQIGARHVLRDLYAMAAGCYRDYQRFGIRCSVKYLWEVERRKIGKVRKRLAAIGADLPRWKSYRLNNNFTALIARHMIEHHPEWRKMMETRERTSRA